MSKQVSELMRPATDLVVRSDISLRQAAELFIVHGHQLLMMVDLQGCFCGIVAESAVVRRLMSTSDTNSGVQEIVHTHIETAHADTHLTKVMPLFRSSCHSSIPVLDNQRHVIGVLNRNDIVRYLLDTDTSTDAGKGPHFDQQRRPTADSLQQDRMDKKGQK